METVRRIIVLIWKEFLALMKDPRSRSVLILPPLVQTIIFGYSATFDINDVRCAILDEDHSAESRDLIAGVRGSEHFRIVAELTGTEQIAEVINPAEAVLVVHIGPDFARDLQSGHRPTVQVILDGRNSNTSFVALSYLNVIVQQFNMSREKQDDGARRVHVVHRSWFNPNLISRWFFVPGIIATVTLIVTLLVTALSVAREREQGTFDQLLVAPYRPIDILIGKAAPGFILGILQSTFMAMLTVYWFDVPMRGGLLPFYTGMVLFLFSMVGVGLMISSMSVTMQQGLLGTFIFAMPAVTLSGFATPIANMALPVQYITILNPLRYILVILRGVFIEARPFDLLINQFWPLAVIGVVTLTLAGWLFRRRIY